jgi:hypothetical protein
MSEITWQGKYYSCETRGAVVNGLPVPGNDVFLLQARPGRVIRTATKADPEEARRWLSDHGLKKSKAKQLVCPTNVQS